MAWRGGNLPFLDIPPVTIGISGELEGVASTCRVPGRDALSLRREDVGRVRGPVYFQRDLERPDRRRLGHRVSCHATHNIVLISV